MAAMFDISLIGDKALEASIGKLATKEQAKMMRKVLRRSMVRIKNKFLLNISGRFVEERTGRMVNAFEAQKIRSRTIRDFGVVVAFKLPPRAMFGDTKDYYPVYLEYGTPKLAAKAPIRRTVNEMRQQEIARVSADLERELDRVISRLRIAA